MKIGLVIAAGLLLAGTVGAQAQGNSRAGYERYVITPVEGGVLRVDRLTGAVSLCSRSGGEWSCKPVADDRAPDAQALRERPPADDLDAPDDEQSDDMGDGGMMTKQDVDQALDTLEYMMKRIQGTAKRLQDMREPPR